MSGTFRRCATLVGTLSLLAGCADAWVQSTEQMLAAAGFQQLPADTPERQNQLALTPSHELVQGQGWTQTYVYADPDICHCLWVGDARNLQAFQLLVFQQGLADEYARSTEMWYGYAWAPWGGGWWYYVGRGHGHWHEHHPHGGSGHAGGHPGGGGHGGGTHGGGGHGGGGSR